MIILCRVYGEVIKVKNEFISGISGVTGQGFGFNRELNSYTSFLKQFYEEANVAPEAVEYVEAFGSGKYHNEQSNKTTRSTFISIVLNLLKRDGRANYVYNLPSTNTHGGHAHGGHRDGQQNCSLVRFSK